MWRFFYPQQLSLLQSAWLWRATSAQPHHLFTEICKWMDYNTADMVADGLVVVNIRELMEESAGAWHYTHIPPIAWWNALQAPVENNNKCNFFSYRKAFIVIPGREECGDAAETALRRWEESGKGGRIASWAFFPLINSKYIFLIQTLFFIICVMSICPMSMTSSACPVLEYVGIAKATQNENVSNHGVSDSDSSCGRNACTTL